MQAIKRKYAFISYNHHDVLWAIRLKAKMIWFKLPSYIKNEFKKSKYLEPIFRDRDYFTSGKLPDMIKRQLDNSRYLIVICSPHSKKSSWVDQEVDYFLNKKIRTEEESDPADYIIPYVLLDEPYDIVNCYPPSLLEFVDRRKIKDKHLSIPKIDGEDALNESLFARLFPKSFKTEKSFARVIACVLGIKDEFDDIWNLHLRMLKRRWKIRMAIAVLIIGAVSFLLYPVRITFSLQEEEHMLPKPDDAVLFINNVAYHIPSMDSTVTVNDIPWYFMFREMPIRFQATYYNTQDTTITSLLLHNSSHVIKVRRDSTYGIFSGVVKTMDGEIVRGAIVQIAPSKEEKGRICTTDSLGRFFIYFPISEQRASMYCSVKIEGKVCYQRSDEVPYDSLILPVR